LTEQGKQSKEESVSIVSNSVENSIMERPECQSPEPSTSYSCKESYCEKADQPSPISVLEPYFSDDVPSPNCNITDHGIDLFFYLYQVEPSMPNRSFIRSFVLNINLP
jgi:hypothetical protein